MYMINFRFSHEQIKIWKMLYIYPFSIEDTNLPEFQKNSANNYLILNGLHEYNIPE